MGRPRGPTVNNGLGKVKIRANPAQWAYLAGFIDGEGYIGARRAAGGQPHSRPLLKVAQKYPAPLVVIQHIFEGSLSVRPTQVKNKTVWQVQGMRLKTILEGVLPYLILKRPQAETALKMFGATGPETQELDLMLRELKKVNPQLPARSKIYYG